MAITKILARKGRLDVGIRYVLNGDKTQEQILTARLNCDPGHECRQMLETKRAVGKEGGVVGCHCENGDLIDRAIAELKAAGKLSPASHPLSHTAVMEAEAVDRWLALAEQAGYPVNVVHLSTQRGLEAARAARKRGQKVYLESCPQYFTLTEDKYHLPGFESAKYVCAPPARQIGRASCRERV